MGYKFLEARYDNDPGAYDTYVHLMYCDVNPPLEEFASLLSTIDVVRDRAAFRSELNRAVIEDMTSESNTEPETDSIYISCESRFGLVSTMRKEICLSLGGKVIR